jgi:hypothetical protein
MFAALRTSKTTSLTAAVLLATSLTARPAKAVQVAGFGVDVETLAVLAQLVTMTKQAVDLYNKTQEGVGLAQETLGAIRDINQAVQSSVFLIQNPDEVLNSARRDFFTSFTELDGINRDAQRLHEDMRASPTGFDPDAYRRAMNSGIQAGNSYQTFLAFREKDYGNLGAESMRTIAGMELIARDNDQVRANLETRTSLTAAEAAAISAKSNVDTAVATATMSRQIAEMARMNQVTFMDAQAARIAEEERRQKSIQSLTGDQTRSLDQVALPATELDDLAVHDVTVDHRGRK